MKKYISKFHYITQDLPHRSHVEQVKIACEAGANWIQYRCLSKNDDELVKEINEIAAICDDWGTTLILTKHFHLLDRVDAQGVHFEDFDHNFNEVIKIIGTDKTVGWSANNILELQEIQRFGADYAFLGPFRFTEFQANRTALLGFDGYKQLKSHHITIPVIAVGGVQVADVDELIRTEVYGIAASSAINHAENTTETIKEFYQKIY